MGVYLQLFVVAGLLAAVAPTTLYEYFDEGVTERQGLEAEGPTFKLNGKDLFIISGAFHYFRVHTARWRETLKKMKHAGLNTVETYMPWNLHNPRVGVYDFGDLGEEMSPFLDISTFIDMVEEEDMFLILRPGPYICSEWDFGGLPSWLLRDPAMKVRSSYPAYQEHFQNYFEQLAPLVDFKQFVKGGSIIAMQIENEFGHFGYEDYPRDKAHLQWIKELFDAYDFKDTLYFTSDSPAITYDWGSLPGILQTANFQANSVENMETLLKLQPDRPPMVMEYWTGWFDHWLSKFHTTLTNPDEFENILSTIFSYNSSVNFYMFIGGTNFGFMAGANVGGDFVSYSPDTTSYDYDAPLTESGDYNEKFFRAKSQIEDFDPLAGLIELPTQPTVSEKGGVENLTITEEIDWPQLVAQAPISLNLTNGPINMEALDINDGNGQSYGYILYSTKVRVPAGESELLIRGHVRDMAQVLVDGKLITSPYSTIAGLDAFGFWGARDGKITFETSAGEIEVEIIVENLGRVNFGKPHVYDQRKGLYEGPVLINGVQIDSWTATPFEFRRPFINSLTNWSDFTGSIERPAVYHTTYDVTGTPKDVWFEMKKWNKGVVFVNGFNLGRYWSKQSPVTTLYVPGPLLNEGSNEIVIYEQYQPHDQLEVVGEPNFSIEISSK